MDGGKECGVLRFGHIKIVSVAYIELSALASSPFEVGEHFG